MNAPANAPMDAQQIKQLIRQELSALMQQDVDFGRFVLQVAREQFADKKETEGRIERILDEMRRDREANERKWREQERKWREQEQRWQEQQEKWTSHLEAEGQRWQEQHQKWEANQAVIQEMLQAIRDVNRRIDHSIGALGARWGLYSEQSFRNALRGILEQSFGVQVINVTEYDDAGEVFGRPDQVELDIIILDGQLIICEVSASISRSEMHAFHRKAQFYEKHHQRVATRKLVISPMVEERAKALAAELGIEVYTHAGDVEPTALK
jgi:hypothetical protein